MSARPESICHVVKAYKRESCYKCAYLKRSLLIICIMTVATTFSLHKQSTVM
jgi:hypothetical protein